MAVKIYNIDDNIQIVPDESMFKVVFDSDALPVLLLIYRPAYHKIKYIAKFELYKNNNLKTFAYSKRDVIHEFRTSEEKLMRIFFAVIRDININILSKPA